MSLYCRLDDAGLLHCTPLVRSFQNDEQPRANATLSADSGNRACLAHQAAPPIDQCHSRVSSAPGSLTFVFS